MPEKIIPEVSQSQNEHDRIRNAYPIDGVKSKELRFGVGIGMTRVRAIFRGSKPFDAFKVEPPQV